MATGLGTHKEKKRGVDIHVQAAGSQICMHRDDTKLSPPAFMDLFTHKLVLVTSPLIGVCGFWLFLSGFVCFFVSWFFAGFS